MTTDFEKALQERFLILDGASGTMLQKSGIKSSTGVGDSLNIENPEAILNLHREYISAGADIIETNTFNNLGHDTNLAGAKLARRAADEAGRKVWVAGSMGPTSRMLSLSADAEHPAARPATFTEQAEAYSAQVEALLEGGVDLFLVETIFDPINAKAALYAIDKVCESKGVRLPVMVSATANDRQGRLLTGQSIEALYHTLEGYGITSFGLNCSFGAKDLEPIIASIAPQVKCAISVYPNAGLPNENGEYEESPQDTAAAIRSMAEKGLINIAGGCCGTTPEHIKAIKSAVSSLAPRQWGCPSNLCPSADQPLVVTGLDKVVIDLKQSNFVNVGERTNVAGSRKFARLISEKNYEEAAAIARKQIEDGASIIDINMDDPMLDSRAEMEYFVRYIVNDPDIAKAAIMVDSSDWETILAGIKNAPGRCIVNSISLKEGEEEFLRRAKEIRRLGAAVIVMAFDEEGQATTYERKTAICDRAYRLLTEKAGYRPQDIIFDVNVLTIGTGFAEHADYAVDFIKAVKWIKANLPGCHCSGGVSNLSFAFRGNNPVREAMHSVFLYHAIEAGLDMAIVNPGMLQIYSQIDPTLLKAVEDVVLNSDEAATERLTAVASEIKQTEAGPQETKAIEWRSLPLEERLSYALTRGISDFLEEDLAQARADLSPVAIIEGPLLSGMEQVGKLFGEGKMFLPQVIKSAKVMRSAVDILQPYITAAEGTKGSAKRKMVLATANGDVHDIGKNILSVVLSCNNIEVIDLGVMVDNSVIMDAIHREKPDMVGISGLITPSLAHMEELCRLMEAAGLELPLFIGGATTSALHTAVKLAPLYSHSVIYTSSASDCASMVNRWNMDPVACAASVREEQDRIRELYASRNEKYLSLEEARAKAPKYPLGSFVQPEGFGQKEIFERNLPVERLLKHINWQMFMAFWGFKNWCPANQCTEGSQEAQGSPELPANDKQSEAQKVYEDGMTELSRMILMHDVEISLRARFFDACAEDETIILPESGERLAVGRSTSSRGAFESLADYFPTAESGLTSRLGLFAVKVKDNAAHCCDDCKDYNHLLRASLCERLAEAAAEYLQEEAACGANIIRPAFGYPACPDHSLKRKAFDLLDAAQLGMSLTESCAMIPETSVCGMLISHPQAHYFNIRTDESN